MKNIINSIFFYFLTPIGIPLSLILIFFNVPDGFYLSLFSLFIIIISIIIIVKYFHPSKFKIDKNYNFITLNKKFKMLAIALCIIIILSGPLDIYINGFKLLNPLSYAELNGYGRYIRHISILCWILIPISYVFIKNVKAKSLFILYAIVFPIVIIDRNRLFNTFYAIIFCRALTPQPCEIENTPKMNTRFSNFKISLFSILVFSILGLFRSGDSFIVESSGNLLMSDTYPLRKIFFHIPLLIQQVILYITTPLFNFATIVFDGFRNDDFLLSQISPFSRDLYDAYPHAPIMVQRFNVGTEFYPWLLYGGLPLVILSFIIMLFSFLWSIQLLNKHPNIFTLLIFLKISYAVLFMGFGPQFFILYNLSFVLLMLMLWMTTSIQKFHPKSTK